MKVSDLIKALQQFAPDAEVIIAEQRYVGYDKYYETDFVLMFDEWGGAAFVPLCDVDTAKAQGLVEVV